MATAQNHVINRHRERSRTERAQLDAVLDAIPYGTLCTVVDGAPWVVPMLFHRDGDRILLHGSTGAGALRRVAAGAPAALCVMIFDGVVAAASTFDSSANYRSAVVYGTLAPLAGDDKWNALNALSDGVIPGRTQEVRDMTDKEQAATLAMALPITGGAWTVKVRTGGPGEDEEHAGVWEGVIPARIVFDEPVAAPWVPTDQAVPESIRRLSEHGWPGYSAEPVCEPA